MLASQLVCRNLMRTSAARYYTNDIKARVVKVDNPSSFKTSSREEFRRAWPNLAAKQEYHLNRLRVDRLPVHRSGVRDDAFNPLLYTATFLCVLYALVQYARMM